MYSIDEIKELINAVDKSSLTELEIKNDKGFKVELKKENQIVKLINDDNFINEKSIIQNKVGQNVKNIKPEVEEKDTYKEIKSPMVGVFYSAPSPDSDPFVKEGTKVNKGDVLCIIEAMKLMNEITADKSGTIKEICIENGEIVEYDETIFKIE